MDQPTTHLRRLTCGDCDTPLAPSGRLMICPRNVAHSTPPLVPEDFWRSAELQTALASWDFGRVLRAYRKAFAPEVTQAMLGAWLDLTQSQISRLERGTTPANRLTKLDQWARRLRVPQSCLWFTLSPQSRREYSGGSQTPTLRPLTKVQGDDVRRRQFIRAATGVGASVVGGSLLKSGERGDEPAPADTTSVNPDVALVRDTTQTFRRLDNRHGGGHARVRVAVEGFLTTTVAPLLDDARQTQQQRELQGAAAELRQLAAWINFDTGHTQAGHAHLQEALRLSDLADDDALAAEMMCAMSHHSAFLRQSGPAVDLALSARRAAKRTGLPALQAESAVLEAHGLALKGDQPGSLAALHAAERLFSLATTERPLWLNYFDEAYLAAKFAHTFRDLGKPREAEQFARRSLTMSEGYERGRLFNTALLASCLADQRKVEEACVVGTQAIAMTGSVRSVRTVTYLSDVGSRLKPFHREPVVKQLFAQLDEAGVVQG